MGLVEDAGKETILLVEDELSLRLIIQKVLQQFGYEVIPAANAGEALELWASHNREIDLLLTDLVMPESLSGRQLAQKLRDERPDLKVVYTSGFDLTPLDASTEEFIEGLNFVQKPFRRETLAAAVRRSLDSGAGSQIRSRK